MLRINGMGVAAARRRSLRLLGLGAAVAFAVPSLFVLSGGTAAAGGGTATCNSGPCAPKCRKASKPHSKACSKARSKAHSASQSACQSGGQSKSQSKGHSKSHSRACSHS